MLSVAGMRRVVGDPLEESPPRAIAPPLVSSAVVLACWIATGKIAATMMNPMPRIITANSTSVNEKPAAILDFGLRMRIARARAGPACSIRDLQNRQSKIHVHSPRTSVPL